MEHDPARGHDPRQRQNDREQRQAGELQPDRRQQPEEKSSAYADGERHAGEDESDLDHGVNR